MEEKTIVRPGYPNIILYQNSHGLWFSEIKLPMLDGFHESKAFQCHSCNSVLLSKYGATKHYCLAFINQQLCQKANQRRKMIIEYIK